MRWVLVAVFGLLQAGDLISTRLALAAGAREGNPIMVKVVDNLPAFITVKTLLVVLLALAAGFADRLIFYIVAAGAIVGYTVVVAHNLQLL